MRLTREELETENARLQDAIATLMAQIRQETERAELAEGIASEGAKIMEAQRKAIDTLRTENRELLGEVRDMSRRLRAAEEMLAPVTRDRDRCLGWIAAKNNKHPIDDGLF